MSNVKTITRAQAIENVLTLCNYANITALKIEGHEDIDWNETANVLAKMHEQLVKPRKATVSKARVLNESLAQKVHAELVKRGDGATTKDIVGFGIVGITTTQKASAVARVGVEMGLLKKLVNGKSVTYAIA